MFISCFPGCLFNYYYYQHHPHGCKFFKKLIKHFKLNNTLKKQIYSCLYFPNKICCLLLIFENLGKHCAHASACQINFVDINLMSERAKLQIAKPIESVGRCLACLPAKCYLSFIFYSISTFPACLPVFITRIIRFLCKLVSIMKDNLGDCCGILVHLLLHHHPNHLRPLFCQHVGSMSSLDSVVLVHFLLFMTKHY